MEYSAIGPLIVNLMIPQNHPDSFSRIPQRIGWSKGGQEKDQRDTRTGSFYRSSNTENTKLGKQKYNILLRTIGQDAGRELPPGIVQMPVCFPVPYKPH